MMRGCFMDADPETATDSLRLVLDLQAPSDFTLAADALYAISFGNHIIASSQFDSSARNGRELLFSMNTNPSTLRMELSSDRKRIKMDLKLTDARLYQDLSQYLLGMRDKAENSNASTVYMPIRGYAEKFQTGDVWMNFSYETNDGIGRGSNPRLNSSTASSGSGSHDSNSTCFISVMNE